MGELRDRLQARTHLGRLIAIIFAFGSGCSRVYFPECWAGKNNFRKNFVRENKDAFAFQVGEQQPDLGVHAPFSIQTQSLDRNGVDRASKDGGDVLLRVAAAKKVFHFQFTRRRLVVDGLFVPNEEGRADSI